MEPPLALITDRGFLAWPANRKTTSPDARTQGVMILPSPPRMETSWRAPSSTASAQNGQISPVSSGLDLCMDSPSAPATAHSTSSSSTDSWSIGYADQDDGDDSAQWDHFEHAQTIPKLEPMDDHVDFDEVKPVPCTTSASRSPVSNGLQAKQKRPRGRPRKNSLTAPALGATKVTKGRSKTGCITCRKRKKKCDEAKPRCMSVDREVLSLVVEFRH